VRTMLVTVAGPRGRRDLSLPADAPVAELLPVLVRLVGDDHAPADGWTLTPAGGRPLAADASLAAGGVLHGALLQLDAELPRPAAPVAPPPPPLPSDGRTPGERTAAALPPRHPLPERATLAAHALMANPPGHPAGGTPAGAGHQDTAPPAGAGRPDAPERRPDAPERRPGSTQATRAPGSLAAALRAATAAAAPHRRATPPGAAAFAQARTAAPPHGQEWGGTGPLERLRRARKVWRSTSYLELLDGAVARPRLAWPVTVAVAAARPGAGATTVAGLLGTLLSLLRDDRVVAVDAGGSDHPGSLWRSLGLEFEEPDGDRQDGAAGDLLARLGRSMPAQASLDQHPPGGAPGRADDLVARLARALPTQAGLDARLGQAVHGLAVLPAPARRAALDEHAWQVALDRLGTLYPVVLLDCGAGLASQPGPALLGVCEQLVLVTDADPAGASLAVEAALPLLHAGLPVTLVVNRMPADGGRLDLDRLGRYLPDARGLVAIPDAPAAASELETGAFTWHHAPAGWRTAVRELAACLVADWPPLGLAR
jgi:MinD-like ATPase involved in chromosome partitioning or flagellar assembly